MDVGNVKEWAGLGREAPEKIAEHVRKHVQLRAQERVVMFLEINRRT